MIASEALSNRLTDKAPPRLFPHAQNVCLCSVDHGSLFSSWFFPAWCPDWQAGGHAQSPLPDLQHDVKPRARNARVWQARREQSPFSRRRSRPALRKAEKKGCSRKQHNNPTIEKSNEVPGSDLDHSSLHCNDAIIQGLTALDDPTESQIAGPSQRFFLRDAVHLASQPIRPRSGQECSCVKA